MTLGYEFQLRPKTDRIWTCSFLTCFQERTVYRGQQHVQNCRSVRCPEADTEGLIEISLEWHGCVWIQCDVFVTQPTEVNDTIQTPTFLAQRKRLLSRSGTFNEDYTFIMFTHSRSFLFNFMYSETQSYTTHTYTFIIVLCKTQFPNTYNCIPLKNIWHAFVIVKTCSLKIQLRVWEYHNKECKNARKAIRITFNGHNLYFII